MKNTVAIIGAGYAGLACAVELARRDVHVTLFDRSRVLGGRARLVTAGERRIDNGQHILLGAYSCLLGLMRTVGASPQSLEQRPLTLVMPGEFSLRAARLPAPLHLVVAFLRARGLSWRERRALFSMLRALRRQSYRTDPDRSVAILLREHEQPQRVIDLLWEPLCLAALNTPLERASARVFVNVLKDSLGAHAGASELLIPRTDLTELFPVQAARYLAKRRGRIHSGITVSGIDEDERGFVLEGDPAFNQRYNQVVIATAPYHAGALLASTGRCARLIEQIEALRHEPITTVYLALDPRERLPEPMIALNRGPAQWAFDRGQLEGEPGLIACVISTAKAHPDLSHEELELTVLAQLETQLGRKFAAPSWTRTITEKRATIACTPDLYRPGSRTSVDGLWLAGDYLDSPYPATLESAARSGVAAATAILKTLAHHPSPTAS